MGIRPTDTKMIPHSATIKPIIEENQLAKYNPLSRRRERSETNFPLKQAKIGPRYNLIKPKLNPNLIEAPWQSVKEFCPIFYDPESLA